MRHGDASQFLPVAKTVSGSIPFHEIVNFGQFLIGTAGIVLKVDAPDVYLASKGYECVFDNETTGYAFLVSPDGFPAGRELIPIPPGQRIRLEAGYKSDLATRIWHAQGSSFMGDGWKTYTPAAITCANMTAPTTANKVFRYKAKEGLLSLDFYIESADGGGASGPLTFSPPFTLPQYSAADDITTLVPFECWVKIGSAAPVKKIGHVNLSDATAADRLMTIITGSLTDDAVIKIWGSLVCPYTEDWDTWVPTIVYATEAAGPDDTETVRCLYKEIDGLMYGFISNHSADPGAGAITNASYTLPFPTIDDLNLAKVAALGIVNINGVYTDNEAYIVADGAAAARVITYDTAFLYVDNQVGAHYLAFCYPLPGQETSYALEDACVWGSTPEDATYTGRYKLVDNDRMYFSGEIAIADTNTVAVSSLTIKPPVPPRKHAKVNIRVIGQKLNNATWTELSGYLDCNQADPDDRLMRFDNLGTFNASEAGGLRFVVVYEV